MKCHNDAGFGYQRHFPLNVWKAILGDFLIRPFVLPERLTADSYKIFKDNRLPTSLEKLPLDIITQMWFMHDKASSHFSQAAGKFLNKRV